MAAHLLLHVAVVCASCAPEVRTVKKIPTLFVRDFTRDNGRYVIDEVTPGCEWVLAGEGVATRKYDGTCVMFDGERWWARREVKAGKPTPPGFQFIAGDDKTGKQVGWEPAEQSPFVNYLTQGIEDLFARKMAYNNLQGPPAGTYELIGPKINGNPEQTDAHMLVEHAAADELRFYGDLDFESIRLAVAVWGALGYEGVVWHHPDGRMAKVKARDFREAGV